MNNQELELKIKEILAIENFFDMVEAVAAFEKEYKTTVFYKSTKMPLLEVIKNAKVWYFMQFETIAEKIQKILNNLDFSNLNNLLNNLGDVYGKENQDILEIFKEFKDIVK